MATAFSRKVMHHLRENLQQELNKLCYDLASNESGFELVVESVGKRFTPDYTEKQVFNAIMFHVDYGLKLKSTTMRGVLEAIVASPEGTKYTALSQRLLKDAPLLSYQLDRPQAREAFDKIGMTVKDAKAIALWRTKNKKWGMAASAR